MGRIITSLACAAALALSACDKKDEAATAPEPSRVEAPAVAANLPHPAHDVPASGGLIDQSAPTDEEAQALRRSAEEGARRLEEIDARTRFEAARAALIAEQNRMLENQRQQTAAEDARQTAIMEQQRALAEAQARTAEAQARAAEAQALQAPVYIQTAPPYYGPLRPHPIDCAPIGHCDNGSPRPPPTRPILPHTHDQAPDSIGSIGPVTAMPNPVTPFPGPTPASSRGIQHELPATDSDSPLFNRSIK